MSALTYSQTFQELVDWSQQRAQAQMWTQLREDNGPNGTDAILARVVAQYAYSLILFRMSACMNFEEIHISTYCFKFVFQTLGILFFSFALLLLEHNFKGKLLKAESTKGALLCW